MARARATWNIRALEYDHANHVRALVRPPCVRGVVVQSSDLELAPAGAGLPGQRYSARHDSLCSLTVYLIHDKPGISWRNQRS